MKLEEDWHQLTAQAWDQEAKQWHKHNQSMWDKGSRKEILPFLKQHFKPGMHLLDIGCSSGYSTFRLNALGYPTHGVDISQEMIELARSNYPQINFSQGNVANLEMASESLDGVLGINVLEFTPSPLIAIKEIYRVLKVDGYACIGILGPTAGPRQNAFRRLYDEPVIMNTMQAWEFQKLAESVGFTCQAGLPIEKKWASFDPEDLPKMAQQALSFMYVFILKKRG